MPATWILVVAFVAFMMFMDMRRNEENERQRQRDLEWKKLLDEQRKLTVGPWDERR